MATFKSRPRNAPSERQLVVPGIVVAVLIAGLVSLPFFAALLGRR